MASSNGGFWSDFWKFLARGNVIDLAVAVIIGTAFNKIVDSLVTDIITPALLNPALTAAGADDLESWAPGGIKWGLFLAAILNFLVIAFVIFLLLRALNTTKKRLLRRAAEEEAATPTDPVIVSQQTLTASIDRLNQTLQSR
ncbi:MAG: large conductance mechanosensitive channel protein MscL [Leptolyngbyaceae cyanobacterium SL_7_1]|nr:large conductance mechanosensitive channel protein MscL [Leptolyngbyaceae cyanobacterium SL_7_1]